MKNELKTIQLSKAERDFIQCQAEIDSELSPDYYDSMKEYQERQKFLDKLIKKVEYIEVKNIVDKNKKVPNIIEERAEKVIFDEELKEYIKCPTNYQRYLVRRFKHLDDKLYLIRRELEKLRELIEERMR